MTEREETYTTEQIRAFATQEADGGWGGVDGAEFDRWLASVKAAAREPVSGERAAQILAEAFARGDLRHGSWQVADEDQVTIDGTYDAAVVLAVIDELRAEGRA